MALSKKRDWMKASEAADYLHISYITLKNMPTKAKSTMSSRQAGNASI